MPIQFFVMHSLNLERCNIFKAELFSFSPNTLRTAAACSVLKGGLLSVTCNSQWEHSHPNDGPIRAHLTDVFARAELAGVVDDEAVGARPQDPGLGQRDTGAARGEGQHPVLGQSELSIETNWPMRGRGYLGEAGDDAVALRVVEVPLDRVDVLARGDGVGAGQNHLGPGLDNVCNIANGNSNFISLKVCDKKKLSSLPLFIWGL